MVAGGVQPNASTMAQLVTSLAQQQLWDDALALLAAMSRCGLLFSVCTS